jgi:hypothetical protein
MPLSDDLLENILTKNYQIEPGRARTLSALAYGSVTNALMMKEIDLDEAFESVITILRYSMGRKYATALKEFNSAVDRSSPESFLLIMKLMLHWFGDAVSQNKYGSIKYFKKYSETIEKFNMRFSDKDLSPVIDAINNYILYLERNISLNVLILNIIFELAKITL